MISPAEINRQTSYYEMQHLWGGRELNLAQQHAITILYHIISALPSGSLVLDAGCGDGLLSLSLKNLCPHVNIMGIDNSQEALAYSKKSDLNVMLADISNLPFAEDSFDFSYSTDVFEHLPTDVFHQAWQELHRVTRGQILIFTPASESDCIVVSCPQCVTAFNPYHHINCMDQEKWLSLLNEKNEVVFFPIGECKPSLPVRGLRSLFLAENVLATVELTQCPLCAYPFSSTSSNGIAINGLVADFAATYPAYFGQRFEELGVLVSTRKNTFPPKPAILNHKVFVDVLVKSRNHIDFNDSRSVKHTLSLFDQGGYYLVGENLNITMENDCRYIQSAGAENRALVILDPSGNGNKMDFVLHFGDFGVGTLFLKVFNKKSMAYEIVGSVECVGDGENKSCPLVFTFSSDQITPYGILLELTSVSENESFTLYLHELEDRLFQDSRFNLEITDGYLPLEFEETLEGKQVELHFPHTFPDKIKLQNENVIYDLSHLLMDDSRRLIIPTTLVAEVKTVSTHKESINL